MLQYIIECIAFQLVFLIIYDIFLKRETFFQWNRFYLIGTYLLSMVLPWIKIEAMKNRVPEAFQAYPEYLWNSNDAVVVGKVESNFNFSWEYTLLYSGMLLAALFFCYKLYQIYTLKQKGEVQYFKDFTRIIISDSAIAFSFFKSIFLGDKVIAKDHQSILQHELVHIRQRHSYDLLFFELMRIMGWFNPLVYVYQGRISELHEFIADAQVSKTNKKEQYQLLLSEVFQTQHISFINQFFKSSLIKKRIVMLQKTKSKKIYHLKYLLLFPIVVGMLFYTSCNGFTEDSSEEIIQVLNIENLTVDEEEKIFNQLMENAKKTKDWELYVKDGNSSLKFVKSDNESYLSGPNGEKTYAKMAIDSKLGESELDLFTAFLGNDVDVIHERVNTQDLYNELIIERQRLLNSSNEKNPIIVNLDAQIVELKNTMTQESETVPFAVVEEVPIFPGCEDSDNKRQCFNEKMREHISKNFNYPKEAQEKGIQGMVSLMLTINKEGVVTKIRKRGPDALLLDEAERIMNLLPTMTPGKDKGNEVNVPYSIPITFKLKQDVFSYDKKGVEGSETLSQKMFEGAYEDIISFSKVDEAPTFPDCKNDTDKRACFQMMIQKHISKNFNYPQEAQEKGIQGRVAALFIITKDGEIKGLKTRGPDKLLVDETKRIISRLPRMIPAVHNGSAADVTFSIPITFKLQ